MTERDDIPQLNLRMDLDDQPGPARPLDAMATESLVNSVLDEVYTPRRRPVWIAWAAAAVVLVMSTGASAGWIYFKEQQRQEAQRNKAKPLPVPAPEIEVAPEVEPELEPELAEVPDVAEPAVEVPEPSRRSTRRVRHAAPVDTGKLLEQANSLRADARYRRADELYQRILQRAPRSDAAYVAAAASADLRAERLKRPKSALRMYKRARRIRPRGALDAEILMAMARVHRTLSEPTSERARLQELLQRHGQSIYASQARTRLRELGQ